MIKIIKSNEIRESNITLKTTAKSITSTVAEIIADVIKRGDKAVHEYTKRFDKCDIREFELSEKEIENAIKNVDPEFIKVMERAARNIEDYHRNQIRTGFETKFEDKGIVLGQKIIPIEKVCCYIPGGTAPYPSSVLMNCIPAKIAGVNQMFITTPPSPTGVDARILAAAKIAGVDKVFTIGGAQAIAAFAFGTETIPQVSKITGPGNAYVAEAKRQVFGVVGIDMLAGPSDILIIADKNANPIYVAADMLSQCEHGTDSPAVLVTNDTELAKKVCIEIEKQLEDLPRKDIAKAAINNHGMIVIVDSIEEAFKISNKLAPEHLEIMLEDPFSFLEKVKNAGSVFLGSHTPEPLGDYYAGPNHILPTSGTAKFSSPLTVDDFVKKTSYSYYSKEALKEVGNDVIRFAEEEGFKAHALSVERRLNVEGVFKENELC